MKIKNLIKTVSAIGLSLALAVTGLPANLMGGLFDVPEKVEAALTLSEDVDFVYCGVPATIDTEGNLVFHEGTLSSSGENTTHLIRLTETGPILRGYQWKDFVKTISLDGMITVADDEYMYNLNGFFSFYPNVRELNISQIDTSNAQGFAGVFSGDDSLETVTLSGWEFNHTSMWGNNVFFDDTPTLKSLDMSGCVINVPLDLTGIQPETIKLPTAGSGTKNVELRGTYRVGTSSTTGDLVPASTDGVFTTRNERYVTSSYDVADTSVTLTRTSTGTFCGISWEINDGTLTYHAGTMTTDPGIPVCGKYFVERIVVDGDIIANDYGFRSLFQNFENCNYINMDGIDTSAVTDMSYAFYHTSQAQDDELEIIFGDDFDTANVTTVAYMFFSMYQSSEWVGEIPGTPTHPYEVEYRYSPPYSSGKYYDIDVKPSSLQALLSHDFSNCANYKRMIGFTRKPVDLSSLVINTALDYGTDCEKLKMLEGDQYTRMIKTPKLSSASDLYIPVVLYGEDSYVVPTDPSDDAASDNSDLNNRTLFNRFSYVNTDTDAVADVVYTPFTSEELAAVASGDFTRFTGSNNSHHNCYHHIPLGTTSNTMERQINVYFFKEINRNYPVTYTEKVNAFLGSQRYSAGDTITFPNYTPANTKKFLGWGRDELAYYVYRTTDEIELADDEYLDITQPIEYYAQCTHGIYHGVEWDMNDEQVLTMHAGAITNTESGTLKDNFLDYLYDYVDESDGYYPRTQINPTKIQADGAVVWNVYENIDSWNTSTNQPFNSSYLIEADLTNFDFSNVTDMSNWFSSASKLETLNMSGVDVSSVTNFSGFLGGCSSLNTFVTPTSTEGQEITLPAKMIDETGTVYAANSNYALDTVSHTLTKQNTVSFVSNGSTISEATYNTGDTFTVPANPVRTNRVFLGWSGNTISTYNYDTQHYDTVKYDITTGGALRITSVTKASRDAAEETTVTENAPLTVPNNDLSFTAMWRKTSMVDSGTYCGIPWSEDEDGVLTLGVTSGASGTIEAIDPIVYDQYGNPTYDPRTYDYATDPEKLGQKWDDEGMTEVKCGDNRIILNDYVATAGLFTNNPTLKRADLTAFDLSNTTAINMLNGNTVLEYADLSTWDMSNITRGRIINGFRGRFTLKTPVNSDVTGWTYYTMYGDTVPEVYDVTDGTATLVTTEQEDLSSRYGQPAGTYVVDIMRWGNDTVSHTLTNTWFRVVHWDGFGNMLADEVYGYGEEVANIPHPANPVKDGYIFAGWQIEEGGNQTYLTKTGLSIVAQWTTPKGTPVTPPPAPGTGGNGNGNGNGSNNGGNNNGGSTGGTTGGNTSGSTGGSSGSSGGSSTGTTSRLASSVPSMAGMQPVVTTKNGNIKVKFNGVTNADGYVIEVRSSEYDKMYFINAQNEDKMSYNVGTESKFAGKMVSVTVSAYKMIAKSTATIQSEKKGAKSDRIYGDMSKTTKCLVSPKAVKKVKATTLSNGKVKLVVKRPAGAKGYKVKYKVNGNTKTKVIGKAKKTTKFKLPKGAKNIKIKAFAKSGKKKAYTTAKTAKIV